MASVIMLSVVPPFIWSSSEDAMLKKLVKTFFFIFFAKTLQKERKIKEIHFYQFRNSPFITLKLSGLGASCNTP
jgi:hypothetical protein